MSNKFFRIYEMMDKTTAEPEAKEIFNRMRLIWFHADDEGKNTNLICGQRYGDRENRQKLTGYLGLFWDFTHCRMVISYRRFGPNLSVPSSRVEQ
jgi:hypothetical protein